MNVPSSERTRPAPSSDGDAAASWQQREERATPPEATAVGTLGRAGNEIWQYRDLLYQLTLRDVRIRYKQAVMGFGWAVFMPMLIVLSGIVVRYAMARLSGTDLDGTILGGIAVKSLPWAFVVGSLGFANTSLIGNMQLVTKVYFPREVLPLASVLAQTFDTLVGAIPLAVVLPLLGFEVSTALLWVPVLVVMLFVLTVAFALLVSAGNVFFRDVKYIVHVMLTFGIFFTPVFFEPAMLGPALGQVIMMNPVAPVLEGLRLAVMEGHHLTVPLVGTDGSPVWSPWYLVYTGTVAVVGAYGALVTFHRLEPLFAEYV